MKKLVSIAAIALFAMTAANATTLIQKQDDICSAISPNGNGSPGAEFASSHDRHIAELWYNGAIGNGLSGGFSALVGGNLMKAPLINSHCNRNTGHVLLNWNTPGFTGTMEGDIDVADSKITNVTGNINGNPISADMNFVGYIS